MDKSVQQGDKFYICSVIPGLAPVSLFTVSSFISPCWNCHWCISKIRQKASAMVCLITDMISVQVLKQILSTLRLEEKLQLSKQIKMCQGPSGSGYFFARVIFFPPFFPECITLYNTRRIPWVSSVLRKNKILNKNPVQLKHLLTCPIFHQ